MRVPMMDFDDRALRRIATFGDAVALVTSRGEIVDAAHVLTLSQWLIPHRYRVVTTSGVREVDTTCRFRRIILDHWKAVYAYVARDDRRLLDRLCGTRISDDAVLECRPEVIDRLSVTGALPPMVKGVRAPWHPLTSHGVN